VYQTITNHAFAYHEHLVPYAIEQTTEYICGAPPCVNYFILWRHQQLWTGWHNLDNTESVLEL